jgi:hypothetical protein
MLCKFCKEEQADFRFSPDSGDQKVIYPICCICTHIFTQNLSIDPAWVKPLPSRELKFP